MPAARADVPADQWELDDNGRAASRAMADAVAGSCYYVSSEEPKALQTLEEMSHGQPVKREPAFGEVRRPWGWSDDYRGQAYAYVAGTCHDGWEPHEQVITRFNVAVSRHAIHAFPLGRLMVIGTHGLALTVWLAAQFSLEPTPADFWANLAFPDLIEVNAAARQARKLLP